MEHRTYGMENSLKSCDWSVWSDGGILWEFFEDSMGWQLILLPNEMLSRSILGMRSSHIFLNIGYKKSGISYKTSHIMH